MKKIANSVQVSIAEVLKEAFSQVQPNGQSVLPEPVTISGQVFPAGATVFFHSDSNGAMKTESSRRAQRHWNQAIIFLGDDDASCVRLHPVGKRTEGGETVEETFTADLKLRGRAKLDARVKVQQAMPLRQASRGKRVARMAY